jgi:2-phospho-L-lactate guanylyltransferase
MAIWVVIPVKPLKDVKRRLAGVLAAKERAQLVLRFLGHELEVLGQSAAGPTVVVSSDAVVVDLAQGYGAATLVEERADGLNAAVARGVGYARSRGAGGVLVLPADLPFLTVEDVGVVLQTVWSGQNGYPASELSVRGAFAREAGPRTRPVMAICADKTGTGTNALLLAPPVDFTFQYGADSFGRHMVEGGRRGLACEIVFAPGLSFDVDTEEDWRLYLERLEIQSIERVDTNCMNQHG